MPEPSERLDSWKAIADYLQRNVATARRWEALGLPVRRVSGAAGRSVYAYTSEIDAWLKTVQTAPSQPPEADVDSAVPLLRSARPRVAAMLFGIAVVILIAWGTARTRLIAVTMPARVSVGADGIVAFSTGGAELWRYAFGADNRAAPPAPLADPQILHGANSVVLAATAYRERVDNRALESGQLLELTPSGALTRAFLFEDGVTFGAGPFTAPWMISDFRVDEQGGARRVALVAHHHKWWPSLVTVLDEKWRRQGTFVHAGWVEQVRWIAPETLLVAGFSNAYDGGMVALLDARSLGGQAPVDMRGEFACRDCGPAFPIRYVVLPRSEVNRASGSPFNRALVQVKSDRVVLGTIEMPKLEQSVEAFYEFTTALEPIAASYGDRYWEAHRALEIEGKITHTRAQCPDRDGPPTIRVWEPKAGWVRVATRSTPPPTR